MLVVLVGLGTIGALFYRERIRIAESLLLQSQQEVTNQQFAPAIDHARAALAATRLLPWQNDLKGRLKTQVAAAERDQARSALHALVEELRFLDNQPLSKQKLATIAAGCTRVWNARQLLIAQYDDGAEAQLPTLEGSLRNDLLDLAVLSARLDVQLALPAKLSDARQQAIRRLNEARQLCGPNPWLDLEEQEYSTEKTQRAPENSRDGLPTPTSAGESYALGQWLMRHGRIAEAKRRFAVAVELTPNEFWPNFKLMQCNFELRHFDEAMNSANICIALQPRRSECYYNRAQCHVALSHDQQALEDFGRSLQIDPDFAPTLLARGILLGQLNRFAEAQADLESAAERGAAPGEVHYQIARLSLAQNNLAQASLWLQRSLTDDPDHIDAIALQKELAVKAHP